MAISAKLVRSQLKLVESILKSSGLETARQGQEKLGGVMVLSQRKKVSVEDCVCGVAPAAFVTPENKRREGVILYLHGGGYCCGNIVYAKGVASMLADKCGVKVFTVAYRLAPESVFPAAIDDALYAYKYLLNSGYDSRDIVLCGESAGGGLVFSLCTILKEQGIPLPSGIIAISPWTDMTASGDSYTSNEEKDPTISLGRLEMFKKLYIPADADEKNPLISPLYGAVDFIPPTLFFVGGDEIMLDDAVQMHEKLLESGVESELIVAPEMWHAYVLYGLKERACDDIIMNEFLDRRLRAVRELSWLRLDNAAKIYPAARRRNWSNAFRLSAELQDEISVPVLKSALEKTVKRFPSVAVRLCKGSFWYYLEEVPEAPEIREEQPYPLVRMTARELHKCAFRVIVYKKRIAVEFFHSITDGNGGLVFLKTLLAEYAEQRYGIKVPAENGVLDRREEPRPEELEDSFLKYSGDVSVSRKDTDAYIIRGTREPESFTHAVTFIADSNDIHKTAKSYGVTVTAFLCAAHMQAIVEIEERDVRKRSRRKPVKVLLPVNLRKIFKSTTLRNFVFYVTPSIYPSMGDYSFEEICKSVYHQMGMEITAKRLGARITTNVNSEKSFIIKIMPLFIKNFVMKMIFNAVGERKSCLTMSNLGNVMLPEELAKYVERLDFVLSVPATTHHNCSVISFNNKTVITFVRNIKEPELERRFHNILRKLGVVMTAESNAAALEASDIDADEISAE